MATRLDLLRKAFGAWILGASLPWLLAPPTFAAGELTLLDDFSTQMGGSEQLSTTGADLFGDSTDVYTGATGFSVTDVSLPGNSSLPVAVQRSMQASDQGRNNTYLVWTRFDVPHLSGVFTEEDGWVTQAAHEPSQLRCSFTGGQPNPPEVFETKDNTMWDSGEYWHGNHLNMPGGGSQLMQVAPSTDANAPTDGAAYHWVTRNRWYFSCLPSTQNGVPGEGFLGVAPDGKRYFFNRIVRAPTFIEALQKRGDGGTQVFLNRDEIWILVTRVEDQFGNWVNYNYSGDDLTSIVANDGRQLTLNYATPGGRLSSVTDGTRTWTYAYTTVAIPGDPDWTSVISVTHPDGTVWRSTIPTPGIQWSSPSSCSSTSPTLTGQSVVTIEHRSGAVGTFTLRPLRTGLSHVFYNPVTYPCWQLPRYFDGVALYQKQITGPGLTPLVWTYTYGPANDCHDNMESFRAPCTASSPTTRTIEVTGPTYYTRYTYGNKWHDTDAMLLRVETGANASSILKDEQRTWHTFPNVGLTPLMAGDSYRGVVNRVLEVQSIVQDGATYQTTNSNWDPYGKPQTIVESGPNGGSRTTQLTYYNNRVKWVIGQVATSSSAGKSSSKTFDANGNVQTATDDGVQTSFTYHADGNLASIQHPRTLVHSFSNYKRGTPQSESQPEAVTASRVVNDAGFITSETDGELHTQSFTQDSAGRVTAVDYPLGNDMSIVYSGPNKLTKTTTRGSLIQVTQYDALRRPVSKTTAGVTTTYEYDAAGRLLFQSNPNDSIGTRFEYDALGRTTKVTNPDSTFRTVQYGAGSVTERDERLNVTTSTYRAYGNPDDALLMGIATPIAAANVTFTRFPNGNVMSMTQGGSTRSFTYDSRNFPLTQSDPETGTTQFEFDDAGNMTARTVGGVRTDFEYDGFNQVKRITFSDGSPQITRTYWKTGQLRTVGTSDATRTFGYDANDNVLTEQLTIGATTLTASYGYNGNDQMSTVTYPVSGRVVNYAPDALGQPTQVSGYVTAVSYWPSGRTRQIDYVNGLVTNYDENSRLLPRTFQARRGSFYYINSTYGYDAAGNLTSVADTVDSTMNRSLDYDGLDRVTVAGGPWGTGTIGYDGRNNVTNQALGSFNLSYSYDAQNRLSSTSGSRSATYSYDALGNVTNAGGMAFTYDAFPNMKCANCNGGAARTDYKYDGLGNRVTVTSGGTTTYEFLSVNGDLLVEYTPSQSDRLIEYIYLNGDRIAQRASDQTSPTPLSPIATALTANATGGVVVGVNVGGSAPAGTVAFSKQAIALGSAFVSGGQASVETGGLSPGLNTITAQYSGDNVNSGNSISFDVTVTVPLPGVPASITVPTSSITGSYAIDWGASSGWVTAYELYEATNASFTGQTLANGGGTARTASISGRSNGTYYYRVRACNPGGCSGYLAGSNAAVVTLPPSTPSSITVPASSTTGAYSISWASSTGTVTAYELYEATNASFTGATVAYSGTGTSVNLTGRTKATYYYRVRACNVGACSGYQTGANPISVTATPGAPASISFTPSTSTNGAYTVDWGISSGTVTAYELYESTSSTFSPQTNVYSGTLRTKSISGKTDGSYYYRVRACNTPIDCSAYQAGATAVTVRIAPSAPSSISVPTTNTTGGYPVTWGAASGTVTAYQLYEATNSSFTGETLVISTTLLSFGTSGKINGTYYYRVRACNTVVSCSGYAPGPNVVTVTLPSGPTAPLNLRKSPSTGTGNIYTILWDPPAQGTASYYILEQSISGVSGPFTPFPQINAPTTSKNFNQSCGEYTYRVKACASGGTCSGYSNTTTKRVCNN